MANEDEGDMPAKPKPVSLSDTGAYFNSVEDTVGNSMVFGGEPSSGKSIAFSAFIALLLGRPAGSA